MREFSKLCPYTDTCYTNVSSQEELMFLGMNGCCDACRCDPQCGLDCCPDMYLKNKKDLSKTKEVQCVDAQYRPYSVAVVNGHSFEMISRCPSTVKDDKIAAKCAREYHDVPFDESFGLFLPVLDHLSGLIYKNSFCARCHFQIGDGDTKYSFLSLLNWNKVEDEKEYLEDIKHNQGSNDKCLRDKIFDPLKRDEWPLLCTQGMMEIDKMCLPPFNETPYTIMIAINIILEPMNGLLNGDYFTLNDIISTIYDETKLKMATLLSRDTTIHSIKGALQFKADGEKTNFDEGHAFKWQNLKSITVQTKFLIDDPKNELLITILDFALGFTNISNYNGAFKSKFNHISHLDVNEQISNNSCSMDLNRPHYQICVAQSDVGEKDLHFELIRYRQELSFTSFRLIVLEPEPFCPRVVLSKQTYISCNESQFISKLYTQDFVSKTLSENETHLLFCHEDYFKHLSSLRSEIDIFGENDGFYSSGQALAVLTIACLILSIISLGFTLVVYAVYPVLRSLPGLINMALVTSLIVFQLVSFVRTVANINISWLCTLIGAFTHFSFILSFAWMFVCTFHMFKVFVYIRNRSVDRNEFRKFISYCLFTSSVAVSLVVITIVISVVRSDGEDTGYGGIICYIKDSTLILCLVALPIALVILMNIAMFCVVVYKIQKHPMLASSNPKERQNITVFAKLSTITGMTWIFGFIYTFTQIETFAFIFIILNAGQGLFIMLSFVCNGRVLDMVCKRKLRRSTTRQTTGTTDV
ncbi:uncharacterized protein LOC132739620 [Ruditapes philippinarum]|uniref:uncharacterized protein LOC132739620 n=1 Tax=Ruditapes philippinarum TaxID=129788 RepID=UPI00295A8904|nr:uncharacterized protein LOC132739620 [Ruditapes philippinarum]